MTAPDDDAWPCCTVCGGTGRDWRTHTWCTACVDGEPLTPRLLHWLDEDRRRREELEQRDRGVIGQ